MPEYTHVIPIHLDALVLDESSPCAEPRVNFSRLPFFDGAEDVKSNIPFLGEELQSIPFRDAPNGLQAGAHLHWALPDALTRSIPTPMLTRSDVRKLITEQFGPEGPKSILESICTFLLDNNLVAKIDEEYFSILVDGETLRKTIVAQKPRINDLLPAIPGLIKLFSPRSTHFPPVPDHWTIKRTKRGQEKTWTLESTFVHTWNEKPSPNSTPFPTGGPAWSDAVIYKWDGKPLREDETGLKYFSPDNRHYWTFQQNENDCTLIKEEQGNSEKEQLTLRGSTPLKTNQPWIGHQSSKGGQKVFYRLVWYDSPQRKSLKVEKLKYFSAGEQGAPPFRYLGRVLEEGYTSTDYDKVPGRYLSTPLTAVGYGEPTFASFYPNCRGVFGFWDDSYNDEYNKQTNYEIIGRYHRTPNFLSIFIRDFVNRLSTKIKADTKPEELVNVLKQAIRSHFQWDLQLKEYFAEVAERLQKPLENFRLSGSHTGPEGMREIKEAFNGADFFPGDSTFFGKVSIAPSLTSAPPEDELELTIGQTGTEALSTFLASKLLPPELEGDQRLVEGFLESLQFSPQLEHLEVDVGATFKALRQQKGFKPYSGGTLWRVRKAPETDGIGQQDVSDQSITLPIEIADSLHELNQAQIAFDRLVWRIEAKKKQLYADWTKYMISQYPPDVWEADYPDIDEMRFFIEQGSLAELEALRTNLGPKNQIIQKCQNRLRDVLAAFQKVRREDIADWKDFYEQVECLITIKNTNWTATTKFTLMENLNELLEVGGVFSHRPKEHFISNRPAYDQPLLVEDFPDWNTMVTGLMSLGELVTVGREEESLDAFLKSINEVLLKAGVTIRTFPTTLGDKKEKYIQPLEIDELNGSLDELRQAAKEVYQTIEAAKVDPMAASFQEDVIRQLNEVLTATSTDFHALAPPIPGKEFNDLMRKKEQEDLSKQEHHRLNRLALEQLLPSLRKRPAFALQHKGNARFHQPTEPVVLIAGKWAEASPKHGQDGRLWCGKAAKEGGIGEAEKRGLIKANPKVFKKNQAKQDRQYPLLMDWQIEYYPDADHIESNIQQAGYSTDYLVRRYEVNPEGPDLKLKNANGTPFAVGSHSYWGSTVLTPGAQNKLKDTLDRFIRGKLKQLPTLPATLKDEIRVAEIGDKESTDSTFDKLFKWYFSESENQFLSNFGESPEIDIAVPYAEYFKQQHPASLDDAQDRASWQLTTAMLARKLMDQHPALSQSLGGFNDALLMLKRGFQLPVKDPLGFPNYQAFTEKIRTAVDRLNFSSVLPHNAFFPIRSGGAKLSDLRLLDTFGREVLRLSDIHQRSISASETLQATSPGYDITLKPRFTQPARLDFRWLSADNDALEMNDHPASSPICGWILLNELDETLLVYNQGGEALGYIDAGGEWRVFPGHVGPVLPEGIGNDHLRRLVNWICKQAQKGGQSGAFDQFFAHLNTALYNIEPDHAAHHQGISLLMSQPLALVRASVQLELKGERVLHQGWDELKGDLKTLLTEGKVDRQSLNYEQIKVPFRLGEHQKLNDGLVAYWIDEADGEGYRNDDFYTPVKPDSRSNLSLEARDSEKIGQSPGLHLNLLMDPRGALHATCGLLPTASLQIPPDQYAEAVKNIEVIFLTAPLITHRGQVQLSLPEEPGYHWSWLAKADNRWSEITTHGHLQKSDLAQKFGDQAASLWNALVNNGVLKPTGGDLAVIQNISSDDPTNTLWKDIPEKLVPKLQLYLGSRQITSFQHSAAFSGPQEIREGWLKLQPDAKEDKA